MLPEMKKYIFLQNVPQIVAQILQSSSCNDCGEKFLN